MRTLLCLLLIVLSVAICANPTAVMKYITEVVSFPMLSESVTVDIMPTVGSVNGSFTFGKIPKPWPENPCVAVWLPVLIKEGAIDPNKTLNPAYEDDADVVMRIGRHTDSGRAIHPRNPENELHPPTAHYEGLDILWFKACSEFKRKQNTIYVAYKQQLIDGVFYYIPIIKATPDSTAGTRSYIMKVRALSTLFPAKGMTCRYENPNPLEMIVTLTDGALVAVTTDPKKAMSSSPTVPKQ